MSEKEIIARTGERPVTRSSLVRDLSALGLDAGSTVIVHSSLSSLGWVCGGAPAVIGALEEILTPEGTLVMPAHSGDLSDPEQWQYPPVPESWWRTIREEMPAFEADLTPSRGMGIIAETFRRQEGVVRSAHPALSFAAWGRERETVTGGHSLAFSLGEHSPLARIYDLDGWILLLGVGYDSNTSLHLAEYRSSYPGKTFSEFGAPVFEGDLRVWKTYRDLEFDSDDFPEIGEAFERQGDCSIGRVGIAEARLMKQRELVDFAAEWLRHGRKAGKSEMES